VARSEPALRLAAVLGWGGGRTYRCSARLGSSRDDRRAYKPVHVEVLRVDGMKPLRSGALLVVSAVALSPVGDRSLRHTGEARRGRALARSSTSHAGSGAGPVDGGGTPSAGW